LIADALFSEYLHAVRNRLSAAAGWRVVGSVVMAKRDLNRATEYDSPLPGFERRAAADRGLSGC
jgi:hypothetical protein